MTAQIITLPFSDNQKNINPISPALGKSSGAQVRQILEASQVPWVIYAYSMLSQPRESLYKDFFDALLRIKKVSIKSDEPSITLAAILEVTGKNPEEVWQVPMSDFVRFLILPKGALSDEEFPGYITTLLDTAGINIGHLDESKSYPPVENKGIESLQGILPEKVSLLEKIGKKKTREYSLSINGGDIERAVNIDSSHFFEAEKRTLLDLFMEAVNKAIEEEGYEPNAIDIAELDLSEGDNNTLITLSFSELYSLTLESVLRNWPLLGA